jgi:hypothetical protein
MDQEEFKLSMTANHDKHSQKNGHERVCRFGLATQDHVKITLNIEGDADALNARFGTWNWATDDGSGNASEIEVLICTPGQLAIMKETLNRLKQKVADLSGAEPSLSNDLETLSNDLDSI